MKPHALAAIAALAALFTVAEAGPKRGKKPPASKKTTAAKGFWKILAQPNAKWVLTDNLDSNEIKTLTVETYDVRKIDNADVARLHWNVRQGKAKETHDIGDTDSGKYTQVAVTSAGLYLFDAAADDAKIAERLKGKPSRSDPPKAYGGSKENNGRYLRIESDDEVCLGTEEYAPPDGECPDTCFAEVCISRTKGIVELTGQWAEAGGGWFKAAGR
jgi:hypothetical protein